MAGKTEERDLTHIPDPSDTRRGIRLDFVFVANEINIKDDNKRIWIDFMNAPRVYPWEKKKQDKRLYNHKIGIYVSQPGRWTLLWFGDRFWKVERRKKLAKKETAWAPRKLKIDVRPLDIEKQRHEDICKCISEML